MIKIHSQQQEQNLTKNVFKQGVSQLQKELGYIQIKTQKKISDRNTLQQQINNTQLEQQLKIAKQKSQDMKQKQDLLQSELQSLKEKERQMITQMQVLKQENQGFQDNMEKLNHKINDAEKSENQVVNDESEIDVKLQILGYKFKVNDLRNTQLQCFMCCEDFIPYQEQPIWHTMELYKYDVEARKKAQTEWKNNVSSRFITKFDCLGGCTGCCQRCAQKWWCGQGKEMKKKGIAVRQCPFCQCPWKQKPQPFVQKIILRN
eukprot:TRINITY_DN9007_c0_g1_i2.p2 TRINITY_DN9007_c0_g1~~TRINITY_DN9007_c0_g1_i2.p2  ORF type:complete len:261 (+),score=18.35 TRINITY_DN9007_c0_g1_i2:71-853(+)